MGKEYDNRNRFSLFKNDRKKEERDPDYTGTYTDENGQEFFCDAWIRRFNKDGEERSMLSGRIGNPKGGRRPAAPEREEPQQPATRSAPPRNKSGGKFDDMNDDIPF